MTSIIAVLSIGSMIYVLAVVTVCVLVTVVGAYRTWQQQHVAAREKLAASEARMAEWRREDAKRAVVKRAYSERYVTIPIDAESPTQALDAITVYAIRLAEQWEKEGRAA